MTEEAYRMASLVRDYMALIARCERVPPYELLSACARLLPRIYVAGLELPDVEPDTVQSNPIELSSPMLQLVRLFGRYDKYSEVFDPVFEHDSVTASLGDDLADIYLDLARPLASFDAGRMSDAVCEWKFNLQGHCGDHLTGALRVIHRLVNDQMPADYNPQVEGAG